MDLESVFTDKAPKPIGPFSQAIKTEQFVFCSGQVGTDPLTGAMISDKVEDQARQALTNLKNVLIASDLSLNNVVKTTIFLESMDNFKIVNQIYESFFGEHKPARTTVQVARLPLDALVEIECIAVR